MKWEPERVEVGGMVAIPKNFGGGYTLCKVERLTPSQVVLEHGMRLVRLTGDIRGPERWGPYNAYTPSDDEMLAILTDMRRESLRNVQWAKLSDDQVRRVWAITQEAPDA